MNFKAIFCLSLGLLSAVPMSLPAMQQHRQSHVIRNTSLVVLGLFVASGIYDWWTKNPLADAIEHRDRPRLQKLIATGRYDVNARHNHMSLLGLATLRGDQGMIHDLLVAGAEDSCYDYGRSAQQQNFMAAVHYNDPAVAQNLLGSEVVTQDEALIGAQFCGAAERGHLEMVQAFLNAGINFINVDERDEEGRTPLMCAARNGKLEVVNTLLEHHADANVQDQWGNTALILATSPTQGLDAVVRRLIAAGAEVNTSNLYGHTALIGAARLGALATVKALVGAGAQVDQADAEGDTPLMHAVGHPDVVRYLREEGADVRHLNARRESALTLCAANRSSAEVAHDLLAAGAQINEKDVYGCTPLMTFFSTAHYQTSHLDMLNELLSAGNIDINATSNLRKTALMYAAQNAAPEEFYRLLEVPGIDLTAKDVAGRDAMAYIRERLGNLPVPGNPTEATKEELKMEQALAQRLAEIEEIE